MWDALAEAMFKSYFSDPTSDEVERAWIKAEPEEGYRASVVLGLLHDFGFDVVAKCQA